MKKIKLIISPSSNRIETSFLWKFKKKVKETIKNTKPQIIISDSPIPKTGVLN